MSAECGTTDRGDCLILVIVYTVLFNTVLTSAVLTSSIRIPKGTRHSNKILRLIFSVVALLLFLLLLLLILDRRLVSDTSVVLKQCPHASAIGK